MAWLLPSLIRSSGGEPLLASMPQAQLIMVAGFVMLGWVLARRQIRHRRRVNQDSQTANKAIREIRDQREPTLPLSNAPVDTQRWQVAMFDLQRELKADLDTRIAIVQTLLHQADERIASLESLEAINPSRPPSLRRQRVHELVRGGRTAEEIASATGLSLREVEQTIDTLPNSPRQVTGR
jgi:hypothetical protein